MTATTDFSLDSLATRQPARMLDGGRMIIRGMQRLVGAALTLAAIGVWLIPGGAWESEFMLAKLLMSLIALLAGLGLMNASATPAPPTVEIDTIRRQVVLVRKGWDGKRQILQRSGFGDLSHAEREGEVVRLWDADQRLVAEVMLKDRKLMSSLLAGLRDAGKIA